MSIHGDVTAYSKNGPASLLVSWLYASVMSFQTSSMSVSIWNCLVRIFMAVS